MNDKMKIVVIGGSGLIGTKLVKKLRERGHEVVSASPSSGVNTITGEGLAQALEGAQVAVDVANAPSWEDQAVLDFFETSGRNLLSAEAAAGVRHHEAGPGNSDQGFPSSLYDCPRHAVLRVRGRHRPIRNRRCNSSVTIRSHAAHRVG
jgi:NAD(P)-dependent dehydrogenase (short-subunit alcohol dehydrogenase family)